MSKKILLADDSITIQKVIGLTFANEDIELTVVDNGDDALVKAREVIPDLIIADVVMPGRDGYEVCYSTKRDPALQHVPVLLLTGTFETFDEAMATKVQADGFITKPFESQALIDKVNELIEAAVARQSVPAVDEAAGVADLDTGAELEPLDSIEELDAIEPVEELDAMESPDLAAADEFSAGDDEPEETSFADISLDDDAPAADADAGLSAAPEADADLDFGDLNEDIGDTDAAATAAETAPEPEPEPELEALDDAEPEAAAFEELEPTPEPEPEPAVAAAGDAATGDGWDMNSLNDYMADGSGEASPAAVADEPEAPEDLGATAADEVVDTPEAVDSDDVFASADDAVAADDFLSADETDAGVDYDAGDLATMEEDAADESAVEETDMADSLDMTENAAEPASVDEFDDLPVALGEPEAVESLDETTADGFDAASEEDVFGAGDQADSFAESDGDVFAEADADLPEPVSPEPVSEETAPEAAPVAAEDEDFARFQAAMDDSPAAVSEFEEEAPVEDVAAADEDTLVMAEDASDQTEDGYVEHDTATPVAVEEIDDEPVAAQAPAVTAAPSAPVTVNFDADEAIQKAATELEAVVKRQADALPALVDQQIRSVLAGETLLTELGERIEGIVREKVEAVITEQAPRLVEQILREALSQVAERVLSDTVSRLRNP